MGVMLLMYVSSAETGSEPRHSRISSPGYARIMHKRLRQLAPARRFCSCTRIVSPPFGLRPARCSPLQQNQTDRAPPRVSIGWRISCRSALQNDLSGYSWTPHHSRQIQMLDRARSCSRRALALLPEVDELLELSGPCIEHQRIAVACIRSTFWAKPESRVA